MLGREQLLVGYQWSWLPCSGFASQLTQGLCVSHPSLGSLLRLTHRAPGLAQHPQNPHLVSGRAHGGAAARKRRTSTDPAGSPLLLCPAGFSDSSEDTPLSLCSVSCLSLPQPPGLVKPLLFDTRAFLRGSVQVDRAGVRAGCATATWQLCVRRILLPSCQAALQYLPPRLTHVPVLLHAFCSPSVELCQKHLGTAGGRAGSWGREHQSNVW